MNCNPHFHKVTSLTASETAVNMTVTNNTNISDLECMEIVLCVCPNTVVTGAPLPYTMTINGVEVPVYNRYSLPLRTNRMQTRKVYHGAYVSTGADSGYVILFDTPECAAFAR